MGTLTKDNYLKIMNESINKAIDTEESPVKEKHVRRLLIASFQFQSGRFFWTYLPVLRLKENQIACWKFCHVLHKMLRDGHRQVLVCAENHRQVLLDCGNLWKHIETGYGQSIHAYCELLFNRISFLSKNPSFPNDLKWTKEHLDALTSQDETGDLSFDLACEFFDSIEDIMRLGAIVLEFYDDSSQRRPNYHGRLGECLLSPLVACVYDSNLFYDHALRILFMLHARLPASMLEGHRERFDKLHMSLRQFYLLALNKHYFFHHIEIPVIDPKPPNFLIAPGKQKLPRRVVMRENYDRDSPDHVMLVNIDDESSISSMQDKQDDHTSDIVQGHPSDQGHSSSNISQTVSSPNVFDTNQDSLTSDPFIVSSTSINPIQADHEAEILRLSDKIEALELCIGNLNTQLSLEKEAHNETKQNSRTETEQLKTELTKLKQDISNMRHQIAGSKNAFDRLMEECQRAKHDNDISQVAMKRLAKEMNELKSKQKDEIQNARQIATKEADAREEDSLMAEMNETDKIIKEATRKIEELSEKSRKIESGIKLQVNEKISEVCTNLMKAVRNLIAQSRLLQREIVATTDNGGAINNPAEFYKRNSSWTEGLISAASVVAGAAKSLVDAADRTMSNQARFAELGAAAHEVAAATTQLVVASRVKADKDSEKLKMLTNAAKQVNQCTSNVVETSRVCAELVEQDVDKIDLSTLSLHQTKKLEMETQVRLLELEESLTKERTKLGFLRRQHYEQEEAQAAAETTSTGNQSSK